MQLGEIEKRQKGQDRQEKEIERGRERERRNVCVTDGRHNKESDSKRDQEGRKKSMGAEYA